jgi:hypothetical protein
MSKAKSDSTSRRALLKGATATAAAAALAAPALAGSGDAELLELGRRFEAALKPWLAVWARDKAQPRRRFYAYRRSKSSARPSFCE